jgi:hypothetical protein
VIQNLQRAIPWFWQSGDILIWRPQKAVAWVAYGKSAFLRVPGRLSKVTRRG